MAQAATKPFKEELDVVLYAIAGVSCVSLLATSLILYIYAKYRPMRRNISFRMIFYLCLSDAIWGADHLLTIIRVLLKEGGPGSEACLFQNWITTYSRLAIIAWTTVIAYAVYLNQVKGRQIEELEDQEGLLQLVATIIPISAAFV